MHSLNDATRNVLDTATYSLARSQGDTLLVVRFSRVSLRRVRVMENGGEGEMSLNKARWYWGQLVLMGYHRNLDC